MLEAVQDHFLPWYCDDHAPSRRALAKASRDEPRRRAAAIKNLGFALEDFPEYVAAELTRCPNGHDAIALSWKTKLPPWPRPPVVVAREDDFDRRYSAVDQKVHALLPFRRRFVTVCATCGAALDDDEAR